MPDTIPTALHIFHADGSIADMTAPLPEDPSLRALHELVDPLVGGRAEHVTISGANGPQDMFVHETGAMDGLPRNETATSLYRRGWMTAHPATPAEELPAIYGTAIVFDRRVWS